MIFDGSLPADATRSFVSQIGARFLLADCGTRSDMAAVLAPLTESVHRFGCAAVYELDGRRADRQGLWQNPRPCGCSRFGAPTASSPKADAILSATDELMRELMARNELEPEAMVSCIFTLTEDLDAEFPAVAARHIGLDRGAAAVRARGAGVPARCRA